MKATIAPADFVYGGRGVSAANRTHAAMSVFGFQEGGMAPDEQSADAPRPIAGRVAFGRFPMSDAAIGLVVGALVLIYLARLGYGD